VYFLQFSPIPAAGRRLSSAEPLAAGYFQYRNNQGIIAVIGDNPLIYKAFGGESGIRTHETATNGLLDFEFCGGFPILLPNHRVGASSSAPVFEKPGSLPVFLEGLENGSYWPGISGACGAILRPNQSTGHGSHFCRRLCGFKGHF